jgi:DNA repair photolyase
MEKILEKLLARPSLQTAQMAGVAVRNELARDPALVMAGLAVWADHRDPLVRVAAGVGYSLVGKRDRDGLPDVLAQVERLARDREPDVREHGASAALEQIWLVHADAVDEVVAMWVEKPDDDLREVVVRTISRIATSGVVTRPSILRRYIERGLALFGRLAFDASPRIRTEVAEAVDEMGCLAPDLVSPFVRELSRREDIESLRLCAEIGRLPFASTVADHDIASIAARLKTLEAKARAQSARWVREGVGGVDYQPLVAANLLVAAKDERLPWTHVADPYRGCQLRCEFCNTRSTAEWIGTTPQTFMRRVGVVRNAAETLTRELDGADMQVREERVLCIGGDSDPYQPAEERFEVTREMLKVCLDVGHPVIVQTRAELILRDLDILEPLAERGLVNVLVSMNTPVEGIRNKIEIGASTVNERLRTMRMLSTKSVPVGMLLSPIMPLLTDDESVLEETVRRAGDAGAKWIVTQVLNLRGSAGVKVRLFLESYASTLLPKYDEIYGPNGKGGEGHAAYVKQMTEEIIPTLAAMYGVDDTSRMLTSGRAPEPCLVRN